MSELTITIPGNVDTETIARAFASAALSTEHRRGTDHPYSAVMKSVAEAIARPASDGWIRVDSLDELPEVTRLRVVDAAGNADLGSKLRGRIALDLAELSPSHGPSANIPTLRASGLAFLTSRDCHKLGLAVEMLVGDAGTFASPTP